MIQPSHLGDSGPRSDAGTRSQTLDRGLRILEALNASGRPMTIAALAKSLDVHRSIVYRMLRTLEDHRLVARTSDGSYELGLGLSILARGVAPNLQTAAVPVLSALANEVRMTAFVVVPSDGEAVTLVSVEPHQSSGHISYSPGTRHPLDRGAPGLAILAAERPRLRERAEVGRIRARGWAHSKGEVLLGMSAVAAPIVTTATPAAVAVVYLDNELPTALPREQLGERLIAAARTIMADLP